MFSARLRSKNLFTGMGNFNACDDKNLFRYSLIDQNSIALSHRSANFPLGFHGQNLAFSMRAGKKTAYELETQALIMSTITNGAKIKNKLIFLPVIYGSLLSRSPRMRFVMAHKGFFPNGSVDATFGDRLDNPGRLPYTCRYAGVAQGWNLFLVPGSAGGNKGLTG